MKNTQIPIFDGHNDTLKQIFFSKRDFFAFNETGNIDLPRAKKGGMKGGIFAIQVPPENIEERKFGFGLSLTEQSWEVRYPQAVNPHFANQFTNEVLEIAFKLEENSNEIKIIRSTNELMQSMQEDIFAIVLHFEGAEAIKSDFSNLEDYYNKGLRSLGLVWSRPNAFGFGVPFKFPCDPDTGPGLTKAGKELVNKCNELGIIIDLTHINEKGFWDVANLSKFPLVVTHANAHAICQSTCNLKDNQIDAVGKSDGIIGVNFDVLNTRSDGKLIADTSLNIIAEHIDYIAKRIGIDHVALGSDFDGAQLPNNLKDVAQLPNLLMTLNEFGYSQEDLEKICYKNWLRVIKATWQ